MSMDQMITQALENIVNDLMYAFDIERELAERVMGTVLRNPKLAMELEAAVKAKRALG